MYNYVYRVLQEPLKQHPPCKISFHTSGAHSSSGKLEKHPKSNAVFKPRKILKKKRLASSRKRAAFFLYNIVWNRLVNPLIDIFIPGVKKVDQLSKLSDFRTHNEFSSKAENSNKVEERLYSRCLEEPKPLDVKIKPKIEDYVIKGPSRVLQNRTVSETESKQIWENKNKHENDTGKTSVVSNRQSRKMLILYNILIKKFVDAKIENLMPNEGNISQICDFRSSQENFNSDYMQFENKCSQEGKETASLNPFIARQIADSNINKNNIKTSEEFNCPLGKTNLYATQAESSQKSFPAPAQMSRPLSEVNMGKVNKTTAESIKIEKKIENTKKTVKPPSSSKIQVQVKPPSKVSPPSTTVLDKVNLKENVVKRLHRISANVKAEQGTKASQIKAVTTDVNKPPPATKYDLTKNSEVKTQFGKRFERDLNANNLSESNNKEETFADQSNEGKILLGDQPIDKNNDTDEVVVKQENSKSKIAADSIKQYNEIDDESTSKNKFKDNDVMLSTKLTKPSSEIKTESVKKVNVFSDISDNSNNQATLKTSNDSSEAKSLETKIKDNGPIERPKRSLDDVKETKNQQVDDIKLENEIQINHRDVQDFSIKDSKIKSSTNINPSVQSKRITNQTGNKIDLQLKLVENKEVADQKHNSCSTDNDEKPSLKDLETHLVSFDKTEGRIVKQEQNLGDKGKGDLIDLSTVVFIENKQKTQNKESNKNKESLLKVNLTNKDHHDTKFMKPWKKGKEDLEKVKGNNSIVENSVSTFHSSINDGEHKVTKGSSHSSLVGEHLKLKTASDSSTDINKELAGKTVALEGMTQQNNQESKISTVSKSHRVTSSNVKPSTNHANHLPQTREKSVDVQKSTQTTEKSIKTKSNESNNPKSENILNNKSDEKVKVLREIKKEKVVVLKRNDPLKEKQSGVKENKTEVTNVKTDSKPTVIKEKTKFTFNDEAEKNKTVTQEEIKNKNSSYKVLKSEHLVRGRISSDNLKQAITESAQNQRENISAKQSSVANSNQREDFNSTSQPRSKSQGNRKDTQNNVQKYSVLLNKSVEKLTGTSSNSSNKNLSSKESKESKFKENNSKPNNDSKQKYDIHNMTTNTSTNIKNHKIENMKRLNSKSSEDDKPNSERTSFTDAEKINTTGNMKHRKGLNDLGGDTLFKEISMKIELDDLKILPKINSSNLAFIREEKSEKEEFNIKMNQLLKSFTVTGRKHKMGINKTKNPVITHKKERIVKENTNIKNNLLSEKNKQSNLNQNSNKTLTLNTNKGETVRPTPKMAQDQLNQKKGNEKTVEDQTAARLKNIARVVPFSKEINSKGNSIKNSKADNLDLTNKVQSSSRVNKIDINAQTEKSYTSKNNPGNNLANKTQATKHVTKKAK